MKKNIIFLMLLLFSGLLYAQSTYSGNLSVAEESFFKDKTDSEDYYLAGCNAFPLGTFVNIKLPYSDDTVNVKIVSKIPEDGIFILIDTVAGTKLDLVTGDVLPVRIEVIDFIPPPLSESEVKDIDPEPEIKGLTAVNLGETPADEETITDEASIEDDSSMDDLTNEASIEDDSTEDKVLDSELPTDDTEEALIEEVTESIVEDIPLVESKEPETDKEVAEEVNTEEPIVEDLESEKIDTAEEEVITEETPEIFEDELPVDSMFSMEEEPITDEVNEESPKTKDPNVKVNKIYYLEPANSKPPEGGIPDSDLIAVTPMEKERVVEDGYYLQVGIYNNSDLIYLDADKLEKMNFPYIKVQEVSPSRERLLVGPLTNDELGVIMLNLKNKGFKDFFRYKKKLGK